jgi:hypothetical protein
MKRSKFTESQIIFALRQTETGVRVQEVCRKMGISEASFSGKATYELRVLLFMMDLLRGDGGEKEKTPPERGACMNLTIINS